MSPQTLARARRRAAQIVTEALNDHGGRLATFEQIEAAVAADLATAYAALQPPPGAVYLLPDDGAAW